MKKRNPVCAILWQDAAFSFSLKKPETKPEPTLTVGFIIETNSEFTNIGTSVGYKNGVMVPKDGFVIPNKTIVDFRKIDFYEKKTK